MFLVFFRQLADDTVGDPVESFSEPQLRMTCQILRDSNRSIFQSIFGSESSLIFQAERKGILDWTWMLGCKIH